MVTRLDRNLRHLSEVIRQDLGREIADLPGAGAAGGMGAGVMAFLGSRLQMGIETVPVSYTHLDVYQRQDVEYVVVRQNDILAIVE